MLQVQVLKAEFLLVVAQSADLRCSVCAAFTVRVGRDIRQAKQAPLLRAQREHLSAVLAHRACCSRLNILSEQGTVKEADPSASKPRPCCHSGGRQQNALMAYGDHKHAYLAVLYMGPLVCRPIK